MVLYFIAFLIIIVLLYTPLSIKIVVLFTNSPQKKYFSIQFSFFTINSDTIENKLKKSKRKKKTKNNKLLKNFNIEKPIIIKSKILISRPKKFVKIEKSIIGFDLDKVGKIINSKLSGINIFSEVNDKNFIWFQANISIKYNLFLIFSTILKTLKLRSRN